MPLKRILFLALLFFGPFELSTSYGQESSVLLDQLAARLVNDSNFVKLIEVENKRVENLVQGVHGLKNADWKLIWSEKAKNEVKTREDMAKLLTKAGMKEVDAFLNLADDYTLYMQKIRDAYPDLSKLNDSDRQAVMKAARDKHSIGRKD